MAGARKLLPTKRVKDIAASLRSDFDINQLNKQVMVSLQQSPQMKMKQFTHRAIFLEKISTEDLQRSLNRLLYRLSEYYCDLLVTDRAKTKCDKYAAFQIHWLQRIRAMVSHGELCATNEGQVLDDEGQLTQEELAIADNIANLTLQCFDQVPEGNHVLILFQTIARQVFHYQQSRIISMKEGTNDDETVDDNWLASDSNDVLLRVCGAQLHKMISIRKEKLTKKETTLACKVKTQKEYDFLRQISMDDSQKESLPVSLKSTELGGRVFPLFELIPFIKQIVQSVRQEINEDSLKKYGDRLFQVGYNFQNINL